MSRELRTLKEVMMNLITVSDAFESVRGKLSKYNKKDLLQAQEYIVASIQCLKKGIINVEKGLSNERKELEDRGENNGKE